MPPLTSSAGSAGGFGLFSPAATYSRPLTSCFTPSGPRALPQSYRNLLLSTLSVPSLFRLKPHSLPAPLAVELVGEDGDLAVLVGARDAPLARLTREQSALLIEEKTVGAGVLAPDAGLALAVELVDVAVVAAGQHAEFGMPRRSLAGRTL